MEYCDTFVRENHIKYIIDVGNEKDTLTAIATEHLRMSGAYWGLCALEILNAGDQMDKEALVEWVKKCQNDDGGFGGNLGHDSNLVYTLSALQILAICDRMDEIDKEKVTAFILSLYQPDGSFFTDKYGELDLRFNYCAVQSMALLGRLSDLDGEQIAKYVCSCQNIDGGSFFRVALSSRIRFDSRIGESFGDGVLRDRHIVDSSSASSLPYCSALFRIGRLFTLGHWLDYRQVDSGGLNGRPEKQCDLCYSWWSLSAMIVLNHVPIDKQGLIDFILKCQDPRGGLSDRPMDERDLYHTYFGIAGAIMLGYLDEQNIPSTHIHPAYALPIPVVERMGLTAEFIPKAEHAMTITRKEIVVFPPFSKQDCECPFIYGSFYWIVLQRSNTTVHCLTGKSFQITIEFCESISVCTFFEKNEVGYLLAFFLSGGYSIIEIFDDGRVIVYRKNGQIDPIPTRNFRSAYACSIPPFEDDSSFSPPICLLTSGGQAFEFYGVDLLNQIWLFSIQFDPLEVRRSLFHTHPTWRITAICRYGQHLLVGTKQGTLFQVSSCDEQILCRLRDREIMKVLKMGDAIVMMDQMDGMWIREKSLQFYDNQRGVRGVIQDHVVGVLNGALCLYPSLESLPISNGILDFCFLSSSTLICLYESGSLLRIEVDSSIWNAPSSVSCDTHSILRDLKRSTSSISQIHSQNQALFDRLVWKKEVTQTFDSFSISLSDVQLHLSDESILCELKKAIPLCVSSLLMIVEDVEGEVHASVHIVSHASSSRMVQIAEISQSAVSTLWTLSIGLIAVKDQQRIVSKMMTVGSFSLLDVGLTEAHREQGVVAPPPQQIHMVDSLPSEDVRKVVSDLEKVGMRIEVVCCGDSRKLLLRGSDSESVQRVRVFLCDWMAKKMKEGTGWLVDLLNQTQFVEEQIRIVEDINPGNDRKERLLAINALLEVNEILANKLLYCFC